ncbi:LysR family transcriptional regulator [Massilia varians]|uniref:LysR family transcriptional regulator n=1 Tax=Massilia varians TaxID=457921 RepID=UPI0025539B93|nr:LysR family transcriptional regulator [Massilia varians]MDK6076490.1 LysR family transcriptional regulator [Massilia varians]
MSDRFEEMRVFAAVVEAGGFTAAAARLGMSKAAVSRHVAELEERLGVRLLHRTTRRLSTTAEGELFHARCRELLDRLEEAEAELGSGSTTAQGVARINVPLSFGLMHLAPLWPRLLERHPGLELDVSLSDRVVDLVDEGYDLAVRIGQLPASSLVSRRLASTRLVACAAPAYLAAHGAPARPAELARHAVIGYSLFASGDTWSFSGPAGEETVKVQPRMRTNNGDTCRAAALAGQGIILQPSFMVGADLAEGRLVELMPGWRSIALGIYAVYPSRKFLAPKVRVIIDFLVEAFADPPWRD